MNEFFVYLPSNSSAAYYKDNTISHFWTKLAQRINLEGDNWEVGLTEISYPPVRDNRIRNKAVKSRPDPMEVDGDISGIKSKEFTHPMTIYVYTNIIKPQFIGDSRSRCLRIVDSSSRHHIFNQPYYFPLETLDIESVEILLTDQFGKLIPFASGDTPSLLILHFRKIRW